MSRPLSWEHLHGDLKSECWCRCVPWPGFHYQSHVMLIQGTGFLGHKAETPCPNCGRNDFFFRVSSGGDEPAVERVAEAEQIKQAFELLQASRDELARVVFKYQFDCERAEYGRSRMLNILERWTASVAEATRLAQAVLREPGYSAESAVQLAELVLRLQGDKEVG